MRRGGASRARGDVRRLVRRIPLFAAHRLTDSMARVFAKFRLDLFAGFRLYNFARFRLDLTDFIRRGRLSDQMRVADLREGDDGANLSVGGKEDRLRARLLEGVRCLTFNRRPARALRPGLVKQPDYLGAAPRTCPLLRGRV